MLRVVLKSIEKLVIKSIIYVFSVIRKYCILYLIDSGSPCVCVCEYLMFLCDAVTGARSRPPEGIRYVSIVGIVV